MQARTNFARMSVRFLAARRNVAMQYSPKNAIPYVAMVDAGTIELVRSSGAKVVSSADLVQKYEACWSAEQLESHQLAGAAIDRIVREAFQTGRKERAREKDADGIRFEELDAEGV